MAKVNKTNAMRFLDSMKVKYDVHTYDVSDGQIDGISVAQKCHEDPKVVYKTLVTRNNHSLYVFVICVLDELDLKKCAKAIHEKSIEMIHVNELLSLTGYVRGGCSPLGMKKNYPIIVSDTIQSNDRIIFSGGKLGLQIECSKDDFLKVTHGQVASICK
ncbi:MAG: Cys-tRNA(Pro) deacylase [Traorella sp.]